ncbi:MAG: M67 family metallopeptidase [Alphaproteobacteria bacterium]
MKLLLSAVLLEQCRAAARRAYPKECCGLIEGSRDGDAWRATAVYESANMAANSAREFLVDPQLQIRLMRELRGSERDVIGCFHSHPDGSAIPSARDVAEAREDDFLWAVIGVVPGNVDVRAYVFRESAFENVEIVATR